MQENAAAYDVIVVGYGPTGLVLASLLGQQGHRVAVVERWPDLYGKPRLTHIDGETARLVSLACDAEHALREAWTTPHYYWMNGKGQLLIDVAAGNPSHVVGRPSLGAPAAHRGGDPRARDLDAERQAVSSLASFQAVSERSSRPTRLPSGEQRRAQH
jgi:choline dehydrogenase-like flavoprotein